MRGARAQASGNTRAATATVTASGAGGGQGGNHHCGVHRHLGGQMSPQHWGGGGGGSVGGGGGGKNDRGVADDDVADVAAGGGGSRHFMWREEQIEQFAHLIRSGEGKRRWVMNDYEFEDTRDPTTAAAAAADGNEDDGENDSYDDDDRQTSSAWSNFIVRILCLTLLLLAYSKLYLSSSLGKKSVASSNMSCRWQR
jgi:hypothetical protein